MKNIEQSGLSSVKDLQEKLAKVEEELKPFLEKRISHGDEWDSIRLRAAEIRQQLFDMTGDWYGKPKVRVQKPDDDLLEANYDVPSAVPPDVLSWVRKNSGTLTSDATDAVRWARIIDTETEDRLPTGEIVVYRAIGAGSEMVDEIRPGDWVTPDITYAEDHLRRWLGGRGKILEMTVDGADVLASPSGNHEEAIYAPLDLSGPLEPVLKTGRRPRC